MGIHSTYIFVYIPTWYRTYSVLKYKYKYTREYTTSTEDTSTLLHKYKRRRVQ